MRIVADGNILGVEALFGACGDLVVRPGGAIATADLADAEVLLVRSRTRLDAALLAGTPVRFAATATAGTDHVDRAALAALGITFAHAPAANAPAVVDWVLGVLAVDSLARDRDPAALRVGVVGCGAVGSRLLARLSALGVACVAVDPPLAEAGEVAVAGVPLAPPEALARCDVLSLHVPLHDGDSRGRHGTRGLLGAALLDGLAPGALVVNASRGPVADASALCRALAAPADRRPVLALDVWPDEPLVPIPLHRAVCIGTAHIAGHSVDAKWQGAVQVRAAFDAWCRRTGRQVLPPPIDVRPPTPPALVARGDDWRALWTLAATASGVARDHADLAAALPAMAADARAAAATFEGLRRAYRVRRDFAVSAVQVPARLAAAARAVGFGRVVVA